MIRALVVFIGLILASASVAEEPMGLETLQLLKRIASGNESRAKLQSIPWTRNWGACKRTGCKRVVSCEHAYHLLLICGQSRRDGDEDGVPCERACCKIDRDGSRSCKRN